MDYFLILEDQNAQFSTNSVIRSHKNIRYLLVFSITHLLSHNQPEAQFIDYMSNLQHASSKS